MNRRVTSGEWTEAGGIEWERYYTWVEERDLRQVFVDAQPYLPDASTAERELMAVDLGCGDGKETLVLLANGWRVIVIDGAPGGIRRLLEAVPPKDAERLTTRVASFADVELPPCDLVYAELSLPFCDPRNSRTSGGRIVAAIRPDGLFAGHFFGSRDTCSGTPDMTFRPQDEVEGLRTDFEVVSLRERDEDGYAASGPKHWHVLHVIARKRA